MSRRTCFVTDAITHTVDKALWHLLFDFDGLMCIQWRWRLRCRCRQTGQQCPVNTVTTLALTPSVIVLARCWSFYEPSTDAWR